MTPEIDLALQTALLLMLCVPCQWLAWRLLLTRIRIKPGTVGDRIKGNFGGDDKGDSDG